MQKWSFAWGAGRIVPLAMACAGVYSIPLIVLSRRAGLPTAPASASGRAYTPYLTAGAISFAGQGLMFITSITLFRQATVANVLYSSRGLWSVVAVWGIGHWFSNREQHLGARVLVWRLVGAILMMAAIVMVLVDAGR